MSRSDLDEARRFLAEALPELRRRFGVTGLWIFGSFARGEAESSSDLDILVDFDDALMTLIKFIEMEQYLSASLGRRVDLVQRSAVRPEIREQIFHEAIAV